MKIHTIKKERNFYKNFLSKTTGFTLVELIIVITILAILATIAFVSFQNYSGTARDGNRIATLKVIEKGLTIYNMKTGFYPDPEKGVEIGSGNLILSKQGIVGPKITQMITLNKESYDPKDHTNYIYSINKNQKKYQLGTYLEQDTLISYIPKLYANIDYSNRYFYTIGNTIGIWFEVGNKIPVGKEKYGSGLDLAESQDIFEIYFSNDSQSGSYIGSGSNLIEMIQQYQDIRTKEIPTPINGVCGTAHKVFYTEIDYGTGTFCEQGIPNPSNPLFPSIGDSTTWACEGINGGTTFSSCSATKDISPLLLSTVSQYMCEHAGWGRVSDTTTGEGDGFCISPTVTGGSEYISWNDIGSASAWVRTSGKSLVGYADNNWGVTYDLGTYSCKELGTAMSGYDTINGDGDTLYNRMKWVSDNKTSSIAFDTIDWVMIPNKPSNFTTPALMFADCIDGTRDLMEGKIYDGVDYTTYSNPTNNIVGRQNMNKYLLGWTRVRGSHLPSAYGNIGNETHGTNETGEYQVACKYFTQDETTATLKSKNNVSFLEHAGYWVWAASVGATDAGYWGSSARILGDRGCESQYNSAVGRHESDFSARFVIR